jgi:CARDB
MRTLLTVVVAGVFVAVFVILSGCGGSSPGPGTDRSFSTVTTYLQAFEDNPSQGPRWMDIADNFYSSAFENAFLYPDGLVQLTYTTAESPLRFGVIADPHELKPNFCYQMKLEGPQQAWTGSPTADFANWQFGFNGRWWCDTATCNKALTDDDVLSGNHNGHLVKGFLYFDFLVTGKDGSVSQTSTANSSYHVTWKASQRSRGASDGPVRTYSVVARPDNWAYDRQYRTTNVGLYGEWEPYRPLPGQVALASGKYEGVQFRLTEETFHSHSPAGGNWRTVMVASGLSFEIKTGTAIHDVAVTDISVPGPAPRQGQTKQVRVTVYNEGTVAETTDVTLQDLTEGTLLGTSPVTVAPGQAATVTFSWTPAVKGDHILEASAVPVTDETDTADNVKTRIVTVR